MKIKFQTIMSLALLALVVGFVSSCKDPLPPKAKIYVIDQEGAPVEDAMVVIRAAYSDSSHTMMVYLSSGPKKISDTTYTENDGVVSKEFLYEAIYSVEVTKAGDNNTPTRRGLGVLILENDKTYEETITITPQTSF
jgi:hypothetical protein